MIAQERRDMTEPVLPRLVPAPEWCRESKESVICLDGEWEIRDSADGSVRKVQVPFDTGVLHRQGLSAHYEYRREILLPVLSADSRVVLKFEGVNGFAQVYVEDVHVASHQNAFLTWNVDITKQVAGREKVSLRVVMDEASDQVSCFNHGGILHSVWLYVLPAAYVNALYLSPLFDEDMDRCTLRVDLDVSERSEGEEAGCQENSGRKKREGCCPGRKEHASDAGDDLWAELCLYDPCGQKNVSTQVKLEQRIVPDPLFCGGEGSGSAGEERAGGYFTAHLSVENPRLWDAEHPVLYRLEVTLYRGGEKLETVSRKTGLRKLERVRNRLLVNGREVKLRGACRHEISPRSGRALTRELIRQDVELFKEANCNYIRTSHYPPSEYFLELCDEKGIYVEDEMALAFVAKTTLYTQRDPEQTARFLSHFTELLARDYNHPSVIIWSLCNESFGGYNFDLLNRYVHRKDPTRMTKFSYPMTIQEEHEMPDIWSIHYSEYDTDLAKKRDNVSVGHAPGRDMPVLHDEYIHVCCYNREELRRDPAVRNFWGEGIRIFWDRIWNTEGALGGAIWAGIDETDIYDGGNTQLEWGIIDVWRRKKPEFYMTRKAYSPLKVLHSELKIEERKALLVVENRFCHTNLSEVCMEWKCGTHTGKTYLPEAVCGKAVKVLLPLEDVKPGDELWIAFLDANGCQVDELLVEERGSVIGRDKALLAEEGRKTPGEAEVAICQEQQETILEGDGFRFVFDRGSGLLKGLWVRTKEAALQPGSSEKSEDWQRLLMGGPILNVPYLKLGEWYLTSFGVEKAGQGARVTICGGYRDTLDMTWIITVYGDGTFTTEYILGHLHKHLPKALKLRVGVDGGGLDELGVAYLADPGMDTLAFERQIDPDREWGYAWYPEDHIARRKGIARRFSQKNVWGEKPVTCWSQDMRDDILYGRYEVDYKGTNDFRSTKEDILRACLYGEGRKGTLTVLGGKRKDLAVDGTACRESAACEIMDALSPAHVRLEVVDPGEWKMKDSDARIRYTGTWYSVEDKQESDHGTEMWSREKGARAECTFTGTGIVWYGPQDTTYGMANVYLDGRLVAERLSQRVAGVDFPCSSAGYDKKYHLPIYSVDGLPYGEHTISIEVCGEKAEDASDYYIVIDYLRVLTGQRTEPVRINVNQAFAYPHISWGNYRKEPILIGEGTRGVVGMSLEM